MFFSSRPRMLIFAGARPAFPPRPLSPLRLRRQAEIDLSGWKGGFYRAPLRCASRSAQLAPCRARIWCVGSSRPRAVRFSRSPGAGGGPFRPRKVGGALPRVWPLLGPRFAPCAVGLPLPRPAGLRAAHSLPLSIARALRPALWGASRPGARPPPCSPCVSVMGGGGPAFRARCSRAALMALCAGLPPSRFPRGRFRQCPAGGPSARAPFGLPGLLRAFGPLGFRACGRGGFPSPPCTPPSLPSGAAAFRGRRFRQTRGPPNYGQAPAFDYAAA